MNGEPRAGNGGDRKSSILRPQTSKWRQSIVSLSGEKGQKTFQLPVKKACSGTLNAEGDQPIGWGTPAPSHNPPHLLASTGANSREFCGFWRHKNWGRRLSQKHVNSRKLIAGDQVEAQPCDVWVAVGSMEWFSWWQWWLDGEMGWGEDGGVWVSGWSVSGHFWLKSEPSRTTPATVMPIRNQRLKRSWPFQLSAPALFP